MRKFLLFSSLMTFILSNGVVFCSSDEKNYDEQAKNDESEELSRKLEYLRKFKQSNSQNKNTESCFRPDCWEAMIDTRPEDHKRYRLYDEKFCVCQSSRIDYIFTLICPVCTKPYFTQWIYPHKFY